MVDKRQWPLPTVHDATLVLATAKRVWETQQSVEGTGVFRQAFGPHLCFPSTFFVTHVELLGFLTLLLQDDEVAELRKAIESETAQRQPSAPTGVYSLRVLCDWLPTIRAADAHVPGIRRSAVSSTFVSDVDMAVLRNKLPTARTAEAKLQREKLFVDFDPNGNGYLSLAEIDKGARDVLKLNMLFDCKPVLMRAFQAARRSTPPSAANHNGDYVTKRTFRLLLWYLKQYFNLWQLFAKADESEDRRISQDEFEKILPQLVEIGLVSSEESATPERLFRDADADGGGMLLFEEFSQWALNRGLRAEADCDGPESLDE